MVYKKKKAYKKKSFKPKSYKQRFNDKAINTKIEAKILAIARAEDVKNRNNLILREYWYCQNFLPFYNRLPTGTPVSYSGIVKKIGTIDKTDVNEPLNAPEFVDPDLFQDIYNADPDGTTQGMITTHINGRRFTDQVKITGFTLGFRVLSKAVQVLQQDHQVIGGIDSSTEIIPDQPPNVSRRLNKIKVKYALCGVLRPEAILGTAADPEPDELVKWHRWGYSRNLDDVDTQNVLWIKKRVFIQGEVELNLSTTRDVEKEFTKYVKLKEPLTVLYLPNDQNGQQSRNWEFYMSFRSNVPEVDATQTEDYTPYQPLISFYTKTHYFE